MKKSIEKVFEEKKRTKIIDGEELIECNCGKFVKKEDLTYISMIDVNYFDWWNYTMIERDGTKYPFGKGNINLNKTHKPYNYIAYVPLLKEIPYYFHKWFHKPDYILILDCKDCDEQETDE